MILRKRADRNFIAARVGDHVVDELKRWEDMVLDPMDDYGVDVTAEEALAQEEALGDLSKRRRRPVAQRPVQGRLSAGDAKRPSLLELWGVSGARNKVEAVAQEAEDVQGPPA